MRRAIAGSILLMAMGWGPPVAAEPSAECEARADAVVADLTANAEQPLSEREALLARSAALAGCGDDAGAPSPDPAPEPKPARAQKPEMSASQRFWAGLFSSENKDIKTRAGGKYKYDAEKK